MIQKLKIIVQEIKSGENLDLYITILLAVVISILGIAHVVGFEVLSALILAILALMAGSMISFRRTSENLNKTTSQLNNTLIAFEKSASKEVTISDVLSTGWPDLSEKIKNAKHVSILGTTLSTTCIRYQYEFSQVIKNNGSLRFLLCDFESKDLMKMHANRIPAYKEPQTIQAIIKTNSERLESLLGERPNKDAFQIGFYPIMAPYGMMIIESEARNEIWVKLLSFRNVDKQHPSFKIDKNKDAEWYEFYRLQFEKFWSIARIKEL